MSACKVVTPDENDVWEALKGCKALRTGHFVFTAGNHSNTYIDKVEATNDPDARKYLASLIIKILREHLPELFIKNSTIVGTPMGAISLATTISDLTNLQLAFLEKKGTELVLRGANLSRVQERTVFLIEDIITSGKTTTKALKVLSDAKSKVLGMSCIVNRQAWKPPENLKLFVQLATSPPDIELTSWSPDNCKLCKELLNSNGRKGVPINTDCGHGAEFLEKQPEKTREILSGCFLHTSS